jgi:hypothetical protein
MTTATTCAALRESQPRDKGPSVHCGKLLFTRAMEHDSPKLLFGLACEFLISERVVRPGVVHLLGSIPCRV